LLTYNSTYVEHDNEVEAREFAYIEHLAVECHVNEQTSLELEPGPFEIHGNSVRWSDEVEGGTLGVPEPPAPFVDFEWAEDYPGHIEYFTDEEWALAMKHHGPKAMGECPPHPEPSLTPFGVHPEHFRSERPHARHQQDGPQAQCKRYKYRPPHTSTTRRERYRPPH